MTDEPDDDDRPELLRILFPNKAPARANGHVPPIRIPTSDEVSRYASTALDYEVDAVARAEEGTRNETLNRAGFNIAQLVAGGYLPRNDAWAALASAAQVAGLTVTETRNTLESAFKGGEAHPRVIPDRTTTPVPGATILNFAPPVRVGMTEDNLSDTEDAVDIEAMFPRLDWHALWADTTVDEWILEPLIPARRLVSLFSAPKMGKSLLMLEIAVQVSIGNRRCLGEMLGEGRKVLYVDFENDPRGDVRTRLQAMGYKPDDLANLVYLSFPSLPYLDTVMGGLQLLAIAQHYGVELVIIDTISRAIGGEENANDTWLSFYRNTGVRLKDAGIACLRLDHSGKDATKGMRGGSAKYGDVDAVWMMTQLDDTHFELECTDNRLVVMEKHLTIERIPGPPLRHKVDPTAKYDIKRRRIATALEWIPKLDPPVQPPGPKGKAPNGSGARAVTERLKAMGLDVSDRATEDALETHWRTRQTTVMERNA